MTVASEHSLDALIERAPNQERLIPGYWPATSEGNFLRNEIIRIVCEVEKMPWENRGERTRKRIKLIADAIVRHMEK